MLLRYAGYDGTLEAGRRLRLRRQGHHGVHGLGQLEDLGSTVGALGQMGQRRTPVRTLGHSEGQLDGQRPGENAALGKGDGESGHGIRRNGRESRTIILP